MGKDWLPHPDMMDYRDVPLGPTVTNFRVSKTGQTCAIVAQKK